MNRQFSRAIRRMMCLISGYHAELSSAPRRPKATVDRVTKKVIALLAEWCNPTPASPASIDANHVNLRDTRATNLSNGC
jgi:hypothetical protein